MSSVFPADEKAAVVAAWIDALIQQDPGGRGLAWWADRSDLLDSARSLLSGSRIAITTGFHILARGEIETDGPPGAIVLAEALLALGREVCLLVDEPALPVMRAGLGGASPGGAAGLGGLGAGARSLALVGLAPGSPPDPRAIGADRFSHIVAVERPGRSAAGECVNMRGEIITPHVAMLDGLFTDPERTFTTIAIGDGGNELGFGRAADRVDFFTRGARISCRTPADWCIFSGVSNWGAYGLCAMLSLLTGRSLLPRADHVAAILDAIVGAGAVDGVTLERAATVDGLSLEPDEEILHRLDSLCRGEYPVIPPTQYLGDAALLWRWPGGIGEETSRRVLEVYRALRDDRVLQDSGMVDVVPAYCEVALHFDPSRADLAQLKARSEAVLAEIAVRAAPEENGARPGTPLHRLPVVYDGEDLSRVADRAALDVREVIDRHTRAEYTVAMIGFRPHFPYLIGMDPGLATPRLAEPRTRVAPGSVGIAGAQTGVYPVESPGGWNIIGRTDPGLLEPIKPGDRVLFVEVER